MIDGKTFLEKFDYASFIVMTSSDLRNHLLGITPQKRKLCSVAENGRDLDLRAVTSDIPANDFQIPQHQAIDRRGTQMMLWFVRAIVARAVRSRKGYAVPYDALIPNPDGSATQFQLRFLDISNPSRPGPDLPDPLYRTGS
ncbi:hypothetical protein T12_1464 [Trichinella patagoniensis]|uniref:Uncharacterized protein n=1 Tax=Trichinella patagoniensis TaxID=990121 RepID=A0A0V0Z5A3_9BILA|nr:hypothetical protein T12_1464 [Trichinella patagoniensis]